MSLRVRRVLTTAFYLSLPWLAWLLAREYFPPAQLVGGYLLISPMIAFGIAGYAFVKLRLYVRSDWTPDSESVELFQSISSRAGRPHLRLLGGRFTDEIHGAYVDASAQTLLLCQPAWGAYSRDAKEFAMARAISASIDNEKIKPGIATMWALEFIGCFIATLNLWLIIPLQTMYLVGLTVFSKHRVENEETRIDVLAFQLTGNPKGAVDFLKNQPRNTSQRIARFKGAIGS